MKLIFVCFCVMVEIALFNFITPHKSSSSNKKFDINGPQRGRNVFLFISKKLISFKSTLFSCKGCIFWKFCAEKYEPKLIKKKKTSLNKTLSEVVAFRIQTLENKIKEAKMNEELNSTLDKETFSIGKKLKEIENEKKEKLINEILHLFYPRIYSN